MQDFNEIGVAYVRSARFTHRPFARVSTRKMGIPRAPKLFRGRHKYAKNSSLFTKRRFFKKAGGGGGSGKNMARGAEGTKMRHGARTMSKTRGFSHIWAGMSETSRVFDTV